MQQRTKRPTTNFFFRHKAGAYRSGLEEDIQKQLAEAGVAGEYEAGRIEYILPPKHYTPDFLLPNGILIETKGYFEASDRTKHLEIKKQYPTLDLRFVFQNINQKLNSKSKTTYGAWCEKHGFLYAAKRIPVAWLYEAADKIRLTAAKEVLKRAKN